MSERSRAEPAENIDNRLQQVRLARGLSPAQLAIKAGITRQAVYAIEAQQYLPTTAVSLRLSEALQCRVEDLFTLRSRGETVEGEWLEEADVAMGGSGPIRVKIMQAGRRTWVRPVSHLGEVLTYTVSADGLAEGGESTRRGGVSRRRTRVHLVRDWAAIRADLAVAGCDPAIYLAGDHLRRRQGSGTVVGWTAGSASAIEYLRRGVVHVAGVHVVDRRTGESNLPYLRRTLKSSRFTVVTFATWEAGLLVAPSNPRGIRTVADLARQDVRLINREPGSGARLLLDQQLAESGIQPSQVKGYAHTVLSHAAVARAVAEGRMDVGVGVRSAAMAFGLKFLPLQDERYDLVMPTALLTTHPTLRQLLDTIVSRSFRIEVDALGGYDTRESGKVQVLFPVRTASGG